MDPNVSVVPSTGTARLTSANPNLNGTGAMGTIMTAGGKGAIIQSIQIKSTGDSLLGMVRLFISDGTTNYLFCEMKVPQNDQTAVVPAFGAELQGPLILQPNYQLLASTQNAQNFTVTAYYSDWDDCGCPAQP